MYIGTVVLDLLSFWCTGTECTGKLCRNKQNQFLASNNCAETVMPFKETNVPFPNSLVTQNTLMNLYFLSMTAWRVSE